MRSIINTSISKLALALIFSSNTCLSHSAERPQPPNILFILPDQWRAQAFGFAGDPNAKTPNLDQLQKQSVWFINAVAGVPVCCPTRASLMTGQRATTHGVFLNDARLSTNATTIAEVFRAAGYDTGYIGKWHLDGPERSGFIPPKRHQGFNYWKVLECTHDYNHSFYYGDTPELLKWQGYDAIAQTRDAQQFLRAHANLHEFRTAAVSGTSRRKVHDSNARSPNVETANKPFLLFLAWGPPHDPYETAPSRYRAVFYPDKLKLRPNVPKAAQSRARKDLAGYYAHCAALDDCVGELLTTLEETGLDRNTLVVFTSDHGDMLGSHGMHEKQKPFDESTRVPLLIRLPKSLSTKSRQLDPPINSEDIMPTLLGLCAVPIPKTVEGLDFSPYIGRSLGLPLPVRWREGLSENPSPSPPLAGPAWSEERAGERRPSSQTTSAVRDLGKKDPSDGAALLACIAPFGEWTRRVGGREYRGIRTTRYTYVRDLKGPWLLFDNKTDPYQLKNLVGSPRAAKRQAELEATLQHKLQAAHDDFLPAAYYIRQWNYAVDSSGTIPYTR
jgi:arylsulfatase A-like enzyme